MKIKNLLFAISVLLAASAVYSAPTVDGYIISWPDDGWYQVQAADTYEEICAGGRSCEVSDGMYNVINHTSGVRYDDIVVGEIEPPAPSDGPRVSGLTISWDDDGWYQVQTADTYEDVCNGGASCEVTDGVYNVINHTSGVRYDGVVVGEIEPPAPSDQPTVNGLTISWADDGWYQVQTAETYQEVCAGERSCEVDPGNYVVINHTTGERFEDILVEGEGQVNENNPPSFMNQGGQTVESDSGLFSFSAWAYEISDGDGSTQNISFEVINNSNPELFKIQPNVDALSGTLTFLPESGQSGIAVISILLKDDGGVENGGSDQSALALFSINVTNSEEGLKHKAILTGPVSGASVELFSLSNLENAIAETLSNDTGGFALNSINPLVDNDYYLISVSGGNDLDSYNGGSLVGNEGSIYGLVLGRDISEGGINVTTVSDISWRYIEKNINEMSNNDIAIRLGDIARTLFDSDITGDGDVTEKELISFDPRVDSHRNNLNISYSILSVEDDEGDSIISAYHSNKVEKLEMLLELNFSDRLSFYSAKDTRSEDVKIEVIPFGRGSFSDEFGIIDYDSDREENSNKMFSFYEKNDSLLTITAIPKADTEILSWGGCDRINFDKSQCHVSLSSSHQVTVSFGYIDTQVVNNLVDLSRASVTLDGGSAVYVTINHGDDDLVNKMANIAVDDYVVGAAEEGFLRKISSVSKISDFKYNLETIEATLEEVVKQGTGVFSKVMTNEDIAPEIFESQQGKANKSNVVTPMSSGDPVVRKGALFSEIEGIELVQAENPKDRKFTIKIGGSESTQQGKTYRKNAPIEGVGDDIDKTVVLYRENDVDIVKARGEVKISLKVDVGASYGLFSGLEYFKFIPEVVAEEKLELFIGDRVSLSEKEVKIATIPFNKILFSIGPVPVFITSELDVYIGFDGKVTGKVNTGMQLKQKIRVGVVYNKNAGFNYIGEFNPSWDFIEPGFDVSFGMEGFVKPKVNIKLYGVVGPSVPVKGYVRLKTDVVNADTNIETWKNDRCIGGFDNSAWIGIDSSMQWDIDFNTGKSFLGRVLSEHALDLKANLELFKKEWLIHRWQRGGICDDSKTPPRLKVVGDIVNETTTAFSDQIITKIYLIGNKGGTDLDWKLNYIEDNIMVVSKKSGKVKPGENEVITVIINTSTLDVGNYKNKLEFVNNHDFGLIVGDDESGSTERTVSVKVIPDSISSPENFTAEIFEPTIVKLAWSYPATEQHINLVKGYRIFMSTDQTSWESIVSINGVGTKSYLVPNLLTSTKYYFKIDAYSDDVSSPAVSTSIEIPRIEPEGDCRAHFTGLVLADYQNPRHISEVYVVDNYSEYVGAGLYPDNRQAFPKAVASTFDGIAIDAGTKVTIYSQKSFEGEVLDEKIGPAIVNNMLWENDSRYGPNVEAIWKEPLQTNYPLSVRAWSSSDMHDWSYGSLFVECGY